MEILFILIIGLYLLITVILHIGLSFKPKITTHLPSVTILIAARNEADNLPDCLNSLAKIDYPKDKMEILIINDRSEDNTKSIAQEYCKNHSHFQMFDVKDDIPGLAGKMNALCLGIENTSNEIILITDADCMIAKRWVKEFVKYFEKNVGMCGAMTLLSSPYKKETFFHRLQAIDWIYLQSVAAGICQVSLPLSILGNNFAFRRTAYEEVGGFRKLGYSVTEDMKLMQKIHQTKRWKIIYPLLQGTAIYSKPVKNLKEFYSQRKRWVLGGKNSRWWGLVMMSVSLAAHLLALIVTVSGFRDFQFALALLIIFLADISLILPMLKRFKRVYLWLYIFPFEIFYILYSIVFAIVYLTGKQVDWKGRKLKPMIVE